MNTNQNKHTPAPWLIKNGSFCSVIQSKTAKGFYNVCKIEFDQKNEHVEEEKANARLIAAAPETKEVCDLLKDWNDWSSATTYEEVVKELASIIAKAESAIAKAEGRS